MPLGIVIIGRNEGERLRVCIASALRGETVARNAVVYVDSGSTDDSVGIAEGFGVEVVRLDTTIPFTAGRARNAGAMALLKRVPVESIQFLDGDTELREGWLEQAKKYLAANQGVAVVAGRVRERHPEASVYNLLGDMEWNTAPGKAEEFGGIFMIRARAFTGVGGFDEEFIAGEEPDLAVRLRGRGGGRIMRLDAEMVWHDLGMMRFGQWWRRSVRSGHALAHLSAVHGGAPFYFYRKQARSTLLWAGGIPVAVLILSVFVSAWMSLLLPLAYGYLAFRVMRYRRTRGDAKPAARVYALFTVLGKFAQLLGMMRFYRDRLGKRRSAIIEYRDSAPTPLATK